LNYATHQFNEPLWVNSCNKINKKLHIYMQLKNYDLSEGKMISEIFYISHLS